MDDARVRSGEWMEGEPEEPQHGPPIPLDRYDLRVLSAIRRIMRAADTYSKKLAGEHGITVPQLVCMLRMQERGPLALKDLAGEVFLSPSTVVGIVDRLERQGMVERERSSRDRRLVAVSLSAKGTEVLARAPSPLHEALARSLEGLPESERAILANSLESVVELMQVGPEKAAPILEVSADLSGPQDDGEERSRSRIDRQ